MEVRPSTAVENKFILDSALERRDVVDKRHAAFFSGHFRDLGLT